MRHLITFGTWRAGKFATSIGFVPLSALLLTRDEGVMQALRSVLPEIGIQTDQCASPEIAHLRVVRQKYEAVIVDADSAESIDFMMNLRRLPQTKNAIVFGILEDMPVTVAFQAGANFVLEKPLTPERVHKSFRAAYGMIMRERRRYYRHRVDFVAYLEDEHNREAACVTNISEGGMALKIGFVLVPGLQLKWKFELPDSKQTVEGKGEVSWADVHGNVGVRFVQLSVLNRSRLEEWLSERSIEEPAGTFLEASKGWNQQVG